jgi:hypothetical protein
VAVRLRVELPGEDPVTVEPRLAGPAVPVAASVTAWRPASLIATAVAALAVAGALVFLLVQLSRARSRAEAGRPA